jgi:hypothetical protein
MYLKVMTATEPGFDQHAIYGALTDLRRLAGLIRAKLTGASPGAKVYIRGEFSPRSPYALVLHVREDGFDPAEADPMLSSTHG